MSALTEGEELEEGKSWDVPKERACLRCQTKFESAWSGERVCPSCKRSNDWRAG